jgi:hypothetical protein
MWLEIYISENGVEHGITNLLNIFKSYFSAMSVYQY